MINKKNILSRKAGISYFEISIMIISLFAFSYMLYQSDNLGVVKVKQDSARRSVIIDFLKAWMKRSTISVVSADQQQQTQTVNYNYEVFGGFQQVASDAGSMSCCPRLNNTATCQDIFTSSCETDCPGGCLPTKCEQTSVCKLGCCVDSDEGTCAVNTPKDSCTGTWTDDKGCNTAECQNACCVIGSQSFFTTEKRCEKISSFYGLDKDFRKAITTEVACIALSYSQEEGACLIKTGEETGCRFTTKAECIGLTKDARNFYKDYLCSNPALETSCTKEASTGCVTGRDGVYWFDSCGNQENIYNANKDKSWNNGMVLPLSQSCNPSNGNINSLSCGNCNYFGGSVCAKVESSTAKPTYGNYVCKDLNCHNAPDNGGEKKDRKNGESWCVYDSAIGDGKDVVGSRQWKYYCIDGAVKVEPCGDFRTGICVQSEGDNGFTSAACRPNRAIECISYNSKDKGDDTKLEQECADNADCQIRNMDFGIGYQFSVCTPKYPLGFDLKDNAAAGEQMCKQADFTCTKVETKGLLGGWTCVAGCDCDSTKFTQSENDYCVSLGDCGGYVNILGKTDKGYSVTVNDKASTSLDVNLDQYKNNIKVIAGKFADPGDFSKILEAQYGWGYNYTSPDLSSLNDSIIGKLIAAQLLKSIPIGLGGYLLSSGAPVVPAATQTVDGMVLTSLTPAQAVTEGVPAIAGAEETAPVLGAGFNVGPAFEAMGASAAAALAGAAAGYIIGSLFGVQGQALFLVSCASGTAGALAASVVAAGPGGGLVGGAVSFIAGPEVAQGLFTVLNFGGPSGGLLNLLGPFLGPVGAAFIWGAVAAVVLSLIVGSGNNIRETKVVFSCNTYQPPKGGADCSKCDTDKTLTGDGFKECSKYRCQSLGQTCELINVGTENEACIDNNPNDISAPVISKGDFISPGFNYTNETSSGFSILTESGDCIPEFSPVIYGIKTQEAAQCKYDFAHTSSYDEMQYYVGDSNLYVYNHTIALLMPGMDSLLNASIGNMSEAEQANLASVLRQKLGDMNFFIRCEDKNGNQNIKEYAVRTCVKPGDDLTPPYVAFSTPASSSYLKYNETDTNLTVYVNEPADCRFALNNLKYDDMNNMTCLTGLGDVTMNGWLCSSFVGNLTQNENDIYIKCKDQPWLANTENESKRNVMQESAIVKLMASKGELTVNNIVPNSTISIGQEPTTITLEADTSGGVNDKAECSYSFTGSNMIPFLNTLDKHHSQIFSQMMSGDYTIYVKCEDNAGNIANGTTSFNIELDASSPVIQRVYKNQNKLYLTTQEDAECFYSVNDCDFNIKNGTVMAGVGGQHTADWIPGGKYYIKCRDSWGNEPLGCSIIVKADEVQSQSG